MAYYNTHSSSSSNISSSSSTSESSTYSSPSSLLPQPPISQTFSKSSVPFLWEERPGITKPRKETILSSSPLKPSTNSRNLFYGKSLEYPPLPPPPRLSQAFLSQPRSGESKLCATHSLLRRRPHEASFKRPSKGQEEEEDPFFLALKACTNGENKNSRNGSSKQDKASSDGLQAALRDLFKPTKKGQQRSKEGMKRGGSMRNDERRDDHQWMREKSLDGEEDNGRRGHGKPKVDKFSDFNQAQGQPKQYNAKVAQFGNIHNQGHHKPKQYNAKVAQFGNINNQGHHKPKHKNAKAAQISDINNQGHHHKPKSYAKVVEFNSCGAFIRANAYEPHSSAKQNAFTDLLGCKDLPPVNAAAIHPSFMIQNRSFSFPH